MEPSKPFQAGTEVSIPSARGSALFKFVPPSLVSNPEGSKMAEADLDVIIRSIAKKQHKVLMDAAKKRHGRLMGLAAKARDKETRARHKQVARDTLTLAGAAARRLQITAENAADSYARSMKKAAEEMVASKAVEKKAVEKKATKKKKG
jgi:hypothetical protein